jgi:excisionase family DNA binding protein
MNSQDKVCVSVKDAMAMLSLGRNTTYRVIANGSLRSIKIGTRRRLIPVEAIHDFVRAASQRSKKSA